MSGFNKKQIKDRLNRTIYVTAYLFVFHLPFFATYRHLWDTLQKMMYDEFILRKGAQSMKVSVDVSAEYKEPFAVIHTDRVTQEIQQMIDILGAGDSPITALFNEEELVILKPMEIYMVRVENTETIIYGEKKKYRSRKRLYELASQLGKGFMQISKSTLVNLSYLDSIEPGFSGTMLLKLKNGNKDYVSRTYLPAFKKYLGL